MTAPHLAPGSIGNARPASRGKPPLASVDFARQPFLVIWETTQACDLACVHCRASATPNRDAGELQTTEAMRLIDEVRAFGEDGGVPPLFVLTGGDPLKRPDILPIVEYAARSGVRVAMTPSGTPLMTPEVLERLRDAGLARLAVSLDGASREVHDAFRRVPGSFDWTMRMLRAARDLGLPTQINTTITRRTIGDLEAMSRIVADVGAVLWSVFLVVPTGRAQLEDLPDPEAIERAFEWLARHAESAPHDVKSTAAPHYRRVLVQRQVAARRTARAAGEEAAPLHGGAGFAMAGDAHAMAAAGLPADVIGRAKGVNDGNGFVFVSHRGTIYPSGFLPEPCGNVRTQRLRDVYRDHPTFRALRDTDLLKGKCGMCDFRNVCGGSRARAEAMTGDWLEADPLCAYEPPAWKKAVAAGEAEATAEYFARRLLPR
ncbi:MAG TPA: TIGR04053 family radical SAM/SPASM domain-containing protein [Gemmatimonadaceae bacterium]|nr:TIGR04053 family radical SAM/SPASM domain-containing protein [Gemmatimonadaceae bacterium]